MGGVDFNKNRLHGHLTNIIYLGKTQYNNEIYEGEHDDIVEARLWKQVQQQLKNNSQNGSNTTAEALIPVLLRGMLYCKHCDCLMGHTYTSKKQVRYRYYVCYNAQKNGRYVCPTKSIPASQIEDFVVEQIRGLGQNKQLFEESFDKANAYATSKRDELKQEAAKLKKQQQRLHQKIRDLCSCTGENISELVTKYNEELRLSESRTFEIATEIKSISSISINKQAAFESFQDFDSLWQTLSVREQAKVIGLLIDRVYYDGTPDKQQVSISYKPDGIKYLMEKGQVHE